MTLSVVFLFVQVFHSYFVIIWFFLDLKENGKLDLRNNSEKG